MKTIKNFSIDVNSFLRILVINCWKDKKVRRQIMRLRTF